MPLISSQAIIFSKWPVYEQWNPEAPYNINISAMLIMFVAMNTIFDLLTVCLPLATLRSYTSCAMGINEREQYG